MARHFATIQNKTANSADYGGRLAIIQSIGLWRRKEVRVPGQARGRKSAVGVELSEGPKGVGGQMLLTEAVRCCTVSLGDRHGGPHLA